MTDKHRISRVVTRTGDKGESGLADGSRLSKSAPVMSTMGTLDELSAALGELLVRLTDQEDDLVTLVLDIQHRLFDLGAELALPGHQALTENHVDVLEVAVKNLNDSLPPLKDFILPGGSPAAAWCHYTRAVARRAERTLVEVHQEQTQNAASLMYLNRLSDLLFVIARELNRRAEQPETLWQADR